MSLAAMRIGILGTLLAAVSVSAETFHNQDGVLFEGTLRKVVPQAAVCNVFEENHTPDEYEFLKSNHGRPLDLWQVDFAVRNESGRRIEHLRRRGGYAPSTRPARTGAARGRAEGRSYPSPAC